ncbi:MAG TPA: sugar ABC transporter permease [Mycobacteriales bacterium]|jgi:multiple sugar transport system permease protein
MTTYEETVAGQDASGATPTREKSRRKRKWRSALTAYAFLTPWLLGLVVITLGPMLFSLYLAFTRYDLLSPPKWVGLANFRRMFGADPRFWQSVRVTLTFVLVSVPLVLIVSLLLALFLNRGIRLLGIYRTLFYVPSLIGSSVAIAILWKQVFGTFGIVNRALEVVGLHHGSWVGNPGTALYSIIGLNLWAFGSTMIIFLAGLRQVPANLYEAASVDGAHVFQRFWHITLPQLTPLIFFNVLLDTVHAFQAFTGAYVVSGGSGGPSDSLLFYTLYLYQKGFVEFQMGYAAAMAWLLLAALAVFTAIAFSTARFWVHYGDEA